MVSSRKRASPAQVKSSPSPKFSWIICASFLPQDRVQDFVGMNSFSLLQNTQKALGNDTLFHRHERLIELTSKLREVEANLANHMNHLKSRTQLTKRWRTTSRTTKREDLKTKIAELEAKKSWIVYLKSREVFCQFEIRTGDVKQQKGQEEAKLAPLKQSAKFLDSKKTKYQADLERAKTTNESFMNGIKRKVEEEFDKVEANVDEENAKLREHKNAEADRLKRVENCTVKIEGYEKQLDETRQRGDMDDVKLGLEMNELEHKSKKHDEAILEINDKDEKDESTRRYLMSKIRSTEVELSKMNDLRMSRMKYLEKEQPHVYESVQFFSKPENMARFKGRIHEPMVLHISVTDLTYGRIVERHIGYSELNGFFCEHEDDDLQRRPINDLNQFNREFMQRWGFKTTMMDLIEGPDYYVAYLCQRFHMERILIGDEQAERMNQEICDGTPIGLFYTDKRSFSFKQSNYTKGKVTLINTVQPARVMTTKINDNEKQSLHEQVSVWRTEEKKLEAQSTDEISVARLEVAKKTLSLLDRERKDLDNLKQITDAAVVQHRMKLLDVAEFVAREMAKAQNQGSKPIIFGRQKNLLHSRMELVQNELEEMQGEVKQLEAKLMVLQPQVEQAAKEAEANKKEAIKESNVHEPPADVVAGELNEKAVEKELLQANTQASILKFSSYNGATKPFLGFWMETDPKIVREYQEKMREIADLSKQKDLGEKKLGDIKEEIEREKQAWLNPLQDLIGTVNRNFGRYFTSMGCAGEVQLQKADDENDFAKYGIKILVKFRSSEPLSELGGTKGGTLQSGGERELTTVPFRVIDEINQGMDATNEARFFNLLCSLAKGPNTPQYFLLTPKMLPPVDYPDNVDFHIIFSGPHVNVPLAIHSNADSSDDEGDED
ncbi:Structural maintenance of chromosomes protein 5 [Orchesella cincta]|uniref:Structural maintenance of chromosomes protein 5 n=1 Tax=Orchesella cincta TaxID=48709 RepID=A0A1D2MXV0_ORCCI|nr:Structural maintenance of chromosomes protein 5 [Orchesella cincta]